MKMHYREFPFEVKAVDDGKGTFEGYASTFSNVDLGLDVVCKGAFKKTLQETGGKVPILADHEPTAQIGWNLSAVEDGKGLFVKGWLDLESNTKAREKYSLAKKGMELGCKVGLSIGYGKVKADPDPQNPMIRQLKELKLFEYSLVTFPMNTHAMVTAAKSWQLHQCEDLESAYDLFVETMKEKGYSEIEIKALASKRAAASEENPEDLIVQFLREQTEQFKLRA